MQTACVVVAATLLLTGCATAQLRPPKAIPDVEPEVTTQVANVLASVGAGQLSADLFTDNLRTALGPEPLRQMGATLRPCGTQPALELLERKTKGEDRQYLYRALCDGKPLLVEIDFNKGARINRLNVRPE